jgi:hypothetical protein
MLYKIVTPTWYYQVEINDLEELLTELSEYNCKWHFVDNVICVWSMIEDETKLMKNVECALSEIAMLKTNSEKQSLSDVYVQKENIADVQSIKNEKLHLHPVKKIKLQRTQEEWDKIVRLAKEKSK